MAFVDKSLTLPTSHSRLLLGTLEITNGEITRFAKSSSSIEALFKACEPFIQQVTCTEMFIIETFSSYLSTPLKASSVTTARQFKRAPIAIRTLGHHGRVHQKLMANLNTITGLTSGVLPSRCAAHFSPGIKIRPWIGVNESPKTGTKVLQPTYLSIPIRVRVKRLLRISLERCLLGIPRIGFQPEAHCSILA